MNKATHNALILMTALLPTTGHVDLINFAKSLPNTNVYVLINGRTFEPITSLNRWKALKSHFETDHNVFIRHSVDDNAPQSPEDMKDGFWEWWAHEINSNFTHVKQSWDYVVASEPYGANVAQSLNAEFIPYDIERVHNKAKSTEARNNLWGNWNDIIPEIRQDLQLKATIFGQESVGKTTISKKVSEILKVQWLVEYARPYLETVGTEVTEQKMNNIHAGQKSLQESFFKKANSPAIVLDTDLFSTVGYYEIMGYKKAPIDCVTDALIFASDIYYILPDDIPFVADPLRYGGDVRESDKDLWINLLEKYSQNYVLVPSGTVEEKSQWIADDIKNRFIQKNAPIIEFNREEGNNQHAGEAIIN